MRSLSLSLIFLFLCSFGAHAAQITYTKDIAPILFENCVTCHRAGEVAPMSLRNYDETRPWAKAIKEKVSSREMPPWFADPAHGTFSNDASLTDKEIKAIVKWVNAGAPRGNPKDMPEMPTFTSGWQRGEPDAIIELPTVNIPAEGTDYFPNLSFKAEVDESQWIQAIEIRPSNMDVAHHVVIFMNGFGSGMGNDFNVLGTWALGTAPNVYPKGMGRKLRNGQTLMTNMHYHPNGTATTDTTRIGLYHGEGKLQHEVHAALAGSYSFFIPAGAENHEEIDAWYVEEDIKIISLFPHMHLRGKDMRFTALMDNKRADILLSVPKYDFNWQLFYYPEKPISVPAGSEIEITAHYDNSANNPNNPDPTRNVGFGLQSTDEMMFGIFEYIYDDGDAVVGDTD
ncbi:MAG: thiol-disulfide isomerase [Candidatus Hydrogenedentota bacterium]